MFEPDLATDKLTTTTKFTARREAEGITGATGTTGTRTSLRLVSFPYKGRVYIASPWKTKEGRIYADIYDIKEKDSGKPFQEWTKIGTVDQDISRKGEIGTPLLYNAMPEEEEEEEEEGEEKEETDETDKAPL